MDGGRLRQLQDLLKGMFYRMRRSVTVTATVAAWYRDQTNIGVEQSCLLPKRAADSAMLLFLIQKFCQ